MAQLALTRERHVAGFQQHGSSAILPNFGSSSNSMSLSAVPALGELKKMADRLLEEQQRTRQATETNRTKLQEAQSQLQSVTQAYTNEKAENAQLKAKVKDDQQQIQYVTSKVSLVEAMHDGLRKALNSLTKDVHNVDAYRSTLAQTLDSRFSSCKVAEKAVQELSRAKVEAEHKLAAALQQCERLMQDIQSLTGTIDEDKQKHQVQHDHLVQDLKEATDSANAYSNACQELEAKVVAAHEQTASLRQQLSAQTEAHNEHARSLDEELEAAKATISKFEADLQTSLAKAASAEVGNEELRTTIAKREAQLQAIQEQLDTIKQDSVAQKTVYDALSEEHDQLEAKHDELSLALQAVLTDLLSKLADVQQLTAKLVAESTAKDALVTDHEQKLQQITDLQGVIATAETAAIELQAEHDSRFAALQAELSVSKAETETAKADAEAAIKEASAAGVLKIQHLSDRTAKEMKKVEENWKGRIADADLEQKKLQAQMHDLETEKMALLSELDDKTKQYTDLQGTHTGLSDKLAAEQQALVQMQQAGYQKLAEQQEQHAREATDLKQKQATEQQQAKQSYDHQEQRITDLQQQISKLKLEHQENLNKHVKDREVLLTEANATKDAALKELQARTDAEVQALHQEKTEGQSKLQATQQDLQRTEGALETAHVELEDLKVHMREQGAAIQELQEALNSKETLLKTISMAACQPAVRESPAGRKKSPEAKKSPYQEPASLKHNHKAHTASKGRAEANNVAPSHRKPSSQYDAPEGSSEEDNDDHKSSEDDPSDDPSDAEIAETVKVRQVEQRKRTAGRAPKQHLNKKLRTEKAAVTQGRKSRFTAMSARTMTTEDEDADTHKQKRSQLCRGSKKDERNAAISSRAKPVVPVTKKRVPANGNAKGSKRDLTSSAALDLFAEVSVQPYDRYAYENCARGDSM